MVSDRRHFIGLFQNKNVKAANINTFSSLERRPNIDFNDVFVEEKVNNYPAVKIKIRSLSFVRVIFLKNLSEPQDNSILLKQTCL